MTLEIKGNWNKGFAYDYHITNSIFLGYDDNNHAMFDNSRSAMGELVYQLKYRNDTTKVSFITELLLNEYSGWESFDYIIPAPSSKQRVNQPVVLISQDLSNRINVPCLQALYKDYSCNNKLIKEMDNKGDKLALLRETIKLSNSNLILGKDILLIDDLFRSGATLEVSTEILLNNGARSVCVLAMTKTKRD
ncbi:ComF family protein [Bisgaard Taxon 10/6]|uniref:ComF family protein n=1 Tax=Exercitatus varius TaxID=67857 RepID=UPI00294B5F12|nr:ComF family protein [Exercitatus varius]MDG2918072.1 ComF family protein [Exercitatus varius]